MSGLDLKKKLGDSKEKARLERLRHEKELLACTGIMEALPFPLLSINNLGFVRFFNREAEKLWGMKARDALDRPVALLFNQENNPAPVQAFHTPARSKTQGLHRKQDLILKDGKKICADLLITETDLGDEVHYSLLVLGG